MLWFNFIWGSNSNIKFGFGYVIVLARKAYSGFDRACKEAKVGNSGHGEG